MKKTCLTFLAVLFVFTLSFSATGAKDAHVIKEKSLLEVSQKILDKHDEITTPKCNDSENPDVLRCLGSIDVDRWVEYRIDVKKSGNYQIYPRVATTNSNWAFRVKIDGVEATSLRGGKTGGWSNWAAMKDKAQTIKLEKGIHTLRLEFTQGKLNLNLLYFEYGDKSSTEVQTGDVYTISEKGISRVVASQKISDKQDEITTPKCNDSENTDISRCLGSVDTGRWVEYRINVQKEGNYKIYPRLATPNSTWAFNVKVDGVDAASLTGGKTGGWNVWETKDYLAQTINLKEGIHTLRLEFTKGKMNLNILYLKSE